MKQKTTAEYVADAVNRAEASEISENPQKVVAGISNGRLFVFLKEGGEWYQLLGENVSA
jgi:hypothetical protein